MLVERTALSYAEIAALVGRSFCVAAGPELVLEAVTTPWVVDGRRSYSLLLTGPVDQELVVGTQVLLADGVTMVMPLEPVARDLRFVHYEAAVTELVDAEPTSFGWLRRPADEARSAA
jgi:hypothetical protein